MPSGRLGLVLRPRSDPTPVVEKLTRWARAHGKEVIADARDAARPPDDVVRGSTAQLGEQADALISLGGDGTAIRRMQAGEALEVRLRPRAGLVVRLDPERYERRRGVKLSLLDLPYLPDEMRDALPAA